MLTIEQARTLGRPWEPRGRREGDPLRFYVSDWPPLIGLDITYEGGSVTGGTLGALALSKAEVHELLAQVHKVFFTLGGNVFVQFDDLVPRSVLLTRDEIEAEITSALAAKFAELVSA